jgi:glycosyltransferase involved in cell wall biosynthesis
MLKSDLIIAGSNFIFSHINENYSEYLNFNKKFLVIFRGINTEYFNPSKIHQADQKKLISKWNINKEKPLILLPGRLTFWKGQEMFIEAIRLVKEKMPEKPFCAVILGSDQGRKVYKKKLLRLVEQYRLNDYIKFIDKCELMPLAYQISDIVVSTSIEPETFGRVSVEAQSMEKPIIASNIGGSKETIIDDKTGFLFEAQKPEELSKKIIHVLNLDESTLKFIGIEGRKNVIKKFNIEKMCFSTYSEYKKIIN